MKIQDNPFYALTITSFPSLNALLSENPEASSASNEGPTFYRQLL